MGTTSEELKKLYKKLGGKDPKVAGFSAPGEILNAINEIPLPTEYELPTVTTEDTGDVLVVNEEGKWDKGEAGGGLPEVTTDDNGDILQVVEGAWAKASASSGGVVVVNATYYSSQSLIKYDITNTELVNLINTKQGNVIIVAKNSDAETYYIYRPAYYTNSSALLLAITRPSDTITEYRRFNLTTGTAKQITITLKQINDPS